MTDTHTDAQAAALDEARRAGVAAAVSHYGEGELWEDDQADVEMAAAAAVRAAAPIIRQAVLSEAADDMPPAADLYGNGSSPADWLRERAKAAGAAQVEPGEER